LDFTDIKAPFDGIIDRLHEQQGSLIEEGDMLTSLSDNEVMWVYFNVPEARYLEYMAGPDQGHDDDDDDDDADDDDGDEVDDDADDADDDDGDDGHDDDDHDDDDEQEHALVRIEDLQVELVLANGAKFGHAGAIGAVEGEFNNETGNIAFRADFPNPDSLLRHGQTGSLLIHRVLHDAVVIPQRATFEILDKCYVFLVDEKNVAHQHEVAVEQELEDIYVIKSGVKEGDKFVLEGVREIRDGDSVESGESEFRPPEEVLKNLKNEAE
jgi:membrane fusion protein, multidrug efflux system